MPLLGASARTLGVRPGIELQAMMPSKIVQGGQGDMSVSPDDPINLPVYRRPVAFQGTGKDPVWMIEESDLGILIYGPDPRQAAHGFVEPARFMILDDYQHALAQTQSLWRKVNVWP